MTKHSDLDAVLENESRAILKKAVITNPSTTKQQTHESDVSTSRDWYSLDDGILKGLEIALVKMGYFVYLFGYCHCLFLLFERVCVPKKAPIWRLENFGFLLFFCPTVYIFRLKQNSFTWESFYFIMISFYCCYSKFPPFFI